jgi:hypothetical protein
MTTPNFNTTIPGRQKSKVSLYKLLTEITGAIRL